MMDDLEELSSNYDDSEAIGSGKYGGMFNNLLINSTALGEHYEYLPKSVTKGPAKTPNNINLDNINLNPPIN